MLQTKKRALFAVIIGVLLLSWMFVIFFFSSEDGVKSKQTSTDKVTEMIEIVTPTKPAEEIKEQVVYSQKSIRKAAHFLAYTVLGVLATAFFSTATTSNKKDKLFLSISLCYFYAATDELHQYFVAGRSGLSVDILIDLFGAIAAILLYLFAEKIWEFLKRRKLSAF